MADRGGGIQIACLPLMRGHEAAIMEDRNVIREKALRVALRTGMAPDLELIWEAQDHEGTHKCFGTFRSGCSAHCRW